MTIVGVTGHQRLRGHEDWAWVATQVKDSICHVPLPVVGISSLAIGADQLFAETVLRGGGSIQVVIPFESYADTFSEGDRLNFERLCRLSSQIEVLARVGSDEECYMAAGRHVVDSSNLLVAIWNGKPAEGLGGTADVVEYAVTKKKRVIHINPTNRTVTEK
jgi:hypothetical protein